MSTSELTDEAVRAAADLSLDGYFLSRKDVAQLATALLTARERVAELEASNSACRVGLRDRAAQLNETAAANERIAELTVERDKHRADAVQYAQECNVAQRERDQARADAWDAGAREGYALRRLKLASVLKQNPYAAMQLAAAKPEGE